MGKSPFDDTQVRPTGVTGPKRKKPLVNAVNGNCFNVGLELALASAICVAADNARFASTRCVSAFTPSEADCFGSFAQPAGMRRCAIR